MKFAVIDDLEYDRTLLGAALDEYFTRQQLVGETAFFADGESFLASFLPDEYTAVFLDILMGDGHIDGIETARRIRSSAPHQLLILTTTDPGFALDGFSVQALDYLLKPVKYNMLASVMERIMRLCGDCHSHYIQITENRIPCRIPVDSIYYISVLNHTIQIHTAGRMFSTSSVTFDNLRSQLMDKGNFQNCYRGILVSLDKVQALGESDFTLISGEKIPISRLKKKEMAAAYYDCLFRKTRQRRWVK